MFSYEYCISVRMSNVSKQITYHKLYVLLKFNAC